jgi:hypothetical protein
VRRITEARQGTQRKERERNASVCLLNYYNTSIVDDDGEEKSFKAVCSTLEGKGRQGLICRGKSRK